MVKLTEIDPDGKEHKVEALNIFGDDYPQLISENDLIVGDVIFCYQSPSDGNLKGKVKTLTIQKFTEGIYVHCGVYIGNGRVSDSADGFVRIVEIKTFIKDYTYLVICRCQHLNDERKEKIVAYAVKCKNSKIQYDLNGALSLPKNRKKHRKHIWGKHPKPEALKKNEENVFCSEFVINCFKASGYIEWDNKIYISHMWSPTDLAHDKLLRFEGYISKNGLESIHPDDIFKL